MHSNECIGCTVTECKHHAKTVQQCTLPHIQIVKHGGDCCSKEHTDCGSFEKC